MPQGRWTTKGPWHAPFPLAELWLLPAWGASALRGSRLWLPTPQSGTHMKAVEPYGNLGSTSHPVPLDWMTILTPTQPSKNTTATLSFCICLQITIRWTCPLLSAIINFSDMSKYSWRYFIRNQTNKEMHHHRSWKRAFGSLFRCVLACCSTEACCLFQKIYCDSAVGL